MCFTGSTGGDIGAGIGIAALGPLLLPFAPIIGPAGLEIMGDTQRRKSQVDYANKVAKANRDQMDENRDIATTAFLDQANAANRNLAESQEQTATTNFDKQQEAMKARADALTSAGEAGVSGSSLAAIMADFNRSESTFRQRNEQNLLFRKQQTAAQVSSYYSEAKSRTAAIKPIIQSPIAPVDYIGPILKATESASSMVMPLMKGGK